MHSLCTQVLLSHYITLYEPTHMYIVYTHMCYCHITSRYMNQHTYTQSIHTGATITLHHKKYLKVLEMSEVTCFVTVHNVTCYKIHVFNFQAAYIYHNCSKTSTFPYIHASVVL